MRIQSVGKISASRPEDAFNVDTLFKKEISNNVPNLKTMKKYLKINQKQMYTH